MIVTDDVSMSIKVSILGIHESFFVYNRQNEQWPPAPVLNAQYLWKYARNNRVAMTTASDLDDFARDLDGEWVVIVSGGIRIGTRKPMESIN